MDWRGSQCANKANQATNANKHRAVTNVFIGTPVTRSPCWTSDSAGCIAVVSVSVPVSVLLWLLSIDRGGRCDVLPLLLLTPQVTEKERERAEEVGYAVNAELSRAVASIPIALHLNERELFELTLFIRVTFVLACPW